MKCRCASFIAQRTYPIAYNKWLEEQLGWIDRTDLYQPLLAILSVADFTENGLSQQAAVLRELAKDLL